MIKRGLKMVKHTSQYVCVFLISIYCFLLDKIYGGLAKIICTVSLSRNTTRESLLTTTLMKWANTSGEWERTGHSKEALS